MRELSAEGRKIADDLACRHGVSSDAVAALLYALELGNGTQAQFNHPDLGGMGQWSQGGMIMVGDMFNQGLKYRVDALCNEIATLLRSQPPLHRPVASSSQSQSQNGGSPRRQPLRCGVWPFLERLVARRAWQPSLDRRPEQSELCLFPALAPTGDPAGWQSERL